MTSANRSQAAIQHQQAGTLFGQKAGTNICQFLFQTAAFVPVEFLLVFMLRCPILCMQQGRDITSALLFMSLGHEIQRKS